jgi:hypothetical protein
VRETGRVQLRADTPNNFFETSLNSDHGAPRRLRSNGIERWKSYGLKQAHRARKKSMTVGVGSPTPPPIWASTARPCEPATGVDNAWLDAPPSRHAHLHDHGPRAKLMRRRGSDREGENTLRTS